MQNNECIKEKIGEQWKKLGDWRIFLFSEY